MLIFGVSHTEIEHKESTLLMWRANLSVRWGGKSVSSTLFRKKNMNKGEYGFRIKPNGKQESMHSTEIILKKESVFLR